MFTRNALPIDEMEAPNGSFHTGGTTGNQNGHQENQHQSQPQQQAWQLRPLSSYNSISSAANLPSSGDPPMPLPYSNAYERPESTRNAYDQVFFARSPLLPPPPLPPTSALPPPPRLTTTKPNLVPQQVQLRSNSDTTNGKSKDMPLKGEKPFKCKRKRNSPAFKLKMDSVDTDTANKQPQQSLGKTHVQNSFSKNSGKSRSETKKTLANSPSSKKKKIATKSQQELMITIAKSEKTKTQQLQDLKLMNKQSTKVLPTTACAGSLMTSNRSAEEVQAALQRAREKLQGALEKRDRAAQRLSPVAALTPISALSANLVISNLGRTGEDYQVYFPNERLGLDLGRLHLQSNMAHFKHHQPLDPNSLAVRKLQLQKELQVLKEKLEHRQKSTDSRLTTGDDETLLTVANTKDVICLSSKPSLTKEELEKKRVEAQSVMDISHWKHFVSKQEHMLGEVNRHVLENRQAVQDCEMEQHQAVKEFELTDDTIVDFEGRKCAVNQMISNATLRLLRSRKDLHSEVTNISTC